MTAAWSPRLYRDRPLRVATMTDVQVVACNEAGIFPGTVGTLVRYTHDSAALVQFDHLDEPVVLYADEFREQEGW